MMEEGEGKSNHVCVADETCSYQTCLTSSLWLFLLTSVSLLTCWTDISKGNVILILRNFCCRFAVLYDLCGTPYYYWRKSFSIKSWELYYQAWSFR
jgi:hypothetical protein